MIEITYSLCATEKGVKILTETNEKFPPDLYFQQSVLPVGLTPRQCRVIARNLLELADRLEDGCL